jgi:hypothetical protein
MERSGVNWIVCYWSWAVVLIFGGIRRTASWHSFFFLLALVGFAIGATLTAMWPRSRNVSRVVYVANFLIMLVGEIAAGSVRSGLALLVFVAVAIVLRKSAARRRREATH